MAIALTPGRSQAQSAAPSLLLRPSNVMPTAIRAVEPALASPPPRRRRRRRRPTRRRRSRARGVPNAGNRVALVDIGRIQIPKIGLDQPVHEGVEQMVIDAGPAHWPGTAAFGSWGNVVLAGHRTTHTEPFLRVAELAPGDEIILSDASGTYTYHVTGTQVVANTALWIVDQKPGRNLTIFTCHPIGSSSQRFVVSAELMSTPRPGQ